VRRWWRDVITRAGRNIEDGEMPNHLTPEQRRIILEVVEPTLLPTLRKGGEGSFKLFNFLDRLFASRE
jgi:hypothetical protein